MIDVRKELMKCGRVLGDKGLTPGVSGNLSSRADKNRIVITTSGSANGHLSEDDFAVIDLDGNTVGGGRPSSEKMLHVEFYKMRPDINYILHVHSPCLSAFASARKALDEAVMAEIVYYFGKIPLAPYAMPSSYELVANTAAYFRDYDVVLMANHGVIVGDKTLKDAYLKLELAESYAQTVLNTKILGGAVLLNPEEITQIERLKGVMNGTGA